MKPLTVIAKLKAKSGKEEDLFRALQALIPPTKAEKGCITYDLHRSHDEPGLFIFTESWESRPVWEDHMKTPHIQSFGAKQAELAESWELFTGEQV